MEERKMKITDAQYVAEWRSLLSMFHTIKDSNSKEKYDSLKELAMNSNFLTPAQRSGIIDRCDNCINGTYVIK